MTKTWQLQEAKNRLSEVVDNAIRHGAQTITRHGEPAVVVVSVEQFQKLRAPRKKLTEFLAASPLRGLSLDLKRNKDIPRKVKL